MVDSSGRSTFSTREYPPNLVTTKVVLMAILAMSALRSTDHFVSKTERSHHLYNLPLNPAAMKQS